eukprot:gene14510-17127_t
MMLADVYRCIPRYVKQNHVDVALKCPTLTMGQLEALIPLAATSNSCLTAMSFNPQLRHTPDLFIRLHKALEHRRASYTGYSADGILSNAICSDNNELLDYVIRSIHATSYDPKRHPKDANVFRHSKCLRIPIASGNLEMLRILHSHGLVTSVQSVDFHSLAKHGASQYVEAIGNHVTNLTLWCSFTIQELEHILGLPALESLRLNRVGFPDEGGCRKRNTIDWKVMDIDACARLESLLFKSTTLKELSVIYNTFIFERMCDSLSFMWMRILENVFTHNKIISIFQLSFTYLSYPETFYDSLINNQTLTSLALHGLRSNQFPLVSKVVASNRHLQQLSLLCEECDELEDMIDQLIPSLLLNGALTDLSILIWDYELEPANLADRVISQLLAKHS